MPTKTSDTAPLPSTTEAVATAATVDETPKGKPCKFRISRDTIVDGVIIRDDPSRIVDIFADGVTYLNVRYDAADLSHIDPGTWSDKLT